MLPKHWSKKAVSPRCRQIRLNLDECPGLSTPTMWNEPSPRDLAKIPKLYSTESTPWAQKLIYEHYFIGGCDWYAAEFDRDDRLYFGYVVLNRDFQNSEWGYFSHDELTSLSHDGIEIDRDLYWSPRKAGSIEDIVKGMRY